MFLLTFLSLTCLVCGGPEFWQLTEFSAKAWTPLLLCQIQLNYQKIVFLPQYLIFIVVVVLFSGLARGVWDRQGKSCSNYCSPQGRTAGTAEWRNVCPLTSQFCVALRYDLALFRLKNGYAFQLYSCDVWIINWNGMSVPPLSST